MRRHPAVFLLSSFVFLVGSTAAAQEADNAMLKIGPLSIQPTLLIQNIGRDRNVFNDPDHPKSDFTMTVSPKADVTFHARSLKMTLAQTTDYVYFKQYTDQRGTNQYNTFRADVTLGALQPFAGVNVSNTRGRLNNEIDARARHTSVSYFAGAKLNLFSHTSVGAAVRQSRLKFADGTEFRGESLTRAFNGHDRGIDANIGFALTPLTSLMLVVSKEEQRFDGAPERNADSIRVAPTLSFSPLGLINGTAAFGYRRYTARDPRTPDYSGFVAQVTTAMRLYDRHRVEVTILRDLTYSYERAATYYIGNSYSVAWTYAFIGPMDMRLSASRNLMRYHATADAPTGGDDNYSAYTAGLGYRIARHIRAAVNGDWQRRRSVRAANRQFDNNRVYGSLTWGG